MGFYNPSMNYETVVDSRLTFITASNEQHVVDISILEKTDEVRNSIKEVTDKITEQNNQAAWDIL